VVSGGQLSLRPDLTLKSLCASYCLLPLALIDMADSGSPAAKESSTGFFRNLGKRLKKPVSSSHSQSSYSASLQDNPTRERSPAPRAVFSSVGRLIGSIAGTSATTHQQGDFMDYHLLHGMLSPVQMTTRQPSSQYLSYRCRVLDHPSLQKFRVSNFPSYITVIIRLTGVCRSPSCSGSGRRRSS